MTWNLVLDESYSLLTSLEVGDSIIDIEGLTGLQLVIAMTSTTAKPTWKMAARVIYQQSISDFPDGPIVAELYGRKVRLNKKSLLDVPTVMTSPYALRLLVPYWFTSMSIKLWQLQQL